MTDNEILPAMSNMLKPIKTDIQEIKVKLGITDHKLQSLEESMDHKLQSLEESMDHKLQSMDQRLCKIEITMEKDILPRLERIEDTQEKVILPRLEKIEDTQEKVILPRLKKIELTQENDILPRLQTIESCYTSTYERYKESVEDYDMMKRDISILNEVVMEHSKKLQKIS